MVYCSIKLLYYLLMDKYKNIRDIYVSPSKVTNEAVITDLINIIDEIVLSSEKEKYLKEVIEILRYNDIDFE